MYSNGWLSLEYEYTLNGQYPFAGISFSYPEADIINAKWLGDGPYRVWKNRPWGVHYNVWKTAFNLTQTGYYPWFYPEFKGYYADLTWLQMSTGEGRFMVISKERGLFLRLLQASGLSGPVSYPQSPAGDISFLDFIPAIGTKMATGLTPDASRLGPEGAQNDIKGSFKHTLYFYFGIPEKK